MPGSWLRYSILLCFSLTAGNAAADLFTGEFIGSFDGEEYRLSIHGFARGQYEGEYRAKGERLPLNARRFGDRIAGQIGIAEFKLGFVAQIQDGSLLLHSEDGKIILFRRILSQSGDD